MALVITEACIDVKDRACIAVCPVDCIYGEDEDRQLFIHPVDCIDCGACLTECPVNAIYYADDVPTRLSHFVTLNALYFKDKAATRIEINRHYPIKAVPTEALNKA